MVQARAYLFSRGTDWGAVVCQNSSARNFPAIPAKRHKTPVRFILHAMKEANNSQEVTSGCESSVVSKLIK